MVSTPPKDLIDLFLTTTTNDIIPLTAKGVAAGCKVFGAAIFKKSDLSLVVAATNDETSSPLMHGEVNCIQQFYALPAASRPKSSECIFYSSHSPCSLCLSAITWSGFDNFYYLFTYEDSRDMFAIPHDIKILEEVFRVPAPSDTPETLANRPLYNKKNAFFTAKSIADLIEELNDSEKAGAKAAAQAVKSQYAALSDTYQASKGQSDIPLA